MSEQEYKEITPPQNMEAEMYFLGSLLLDKDAIIKVADIITPEDFYSNKHKLIFDAVIELYAKHDPIDVVSLSSYLQDNNQLEKAGGRSYLAKLSNIVTTPSSIIHYANIVTKKATLRRLLTAASEIAALGHKEDEEVDALLDEAERKLFSVSNKHLKDSFAGVDTLLADAFERIDELHRNTGKLRGIPTGFHDLDSILTGLQKSDLIILAARPSVGKTSFALDIARQCAVGYKAAVGIFSLEMSKEQLVDRMLCAQSNVSLWKMRSGKLSDSEENNDFARINDGMGQLAEAPIFIDDSPSCSVMDIRTKARRLKVEKGLDLLIIDYLQLMEGRGKHTDNRVQEVAEISRGLKGIARELNIPVIALSQLSRAVEATKPAIPKLAHLRDSGSIEQDADVVMFIYRKAADRNYNRDELTPEERCAAEIHIAKHRNGPTGKVDLFFDEIPVSYKNLAVRAQYQ
jgi:replicative DNA helicase